MPLTVPECAVFKPLIEKAVARPDRSIEVQVRTDAESLRVPPRHLAIEKVDEAGREKSPATLRPAEGPFVVRT